MSFSLAIFVLKGRTDLDDRIRKVHTFSIYEWEDGDDGPMARSRRMGLAGWAVSVT